MLPAANRLRSSADFAAVTRRGHRARCGGVVVYLLLPGTDSTPAGMFSSVTAPRLGLIVGKAVGGSVVRHRVSRRLRAQLAQRLDRVPPGARIVVRALAETASEASVELGRDLERALSRLHRPASGPRR